MRCVWVLGNLELHRLSFAVGRGRAFLGNELLTQWKTFGGAVEHLMPTLQKILPNLTAQDLEKAEEKVRESRLAGYRLR